MFFPNICRCLVVSYRTARYPLTHISMNHLKGVASIFPPMIITISSVSLMSGSQPRFPPGELSNMKPKSGGEKNNQEKLWHKQPLAQQALSATEGVACHVDQCMRLNLDQDKVLSPYMSIWELYQCGWGVPCCPAWCCRCVCLWFAAGRAEGCRRPCCGWSCNGPVQQRKDNRKQ